MKRFSVLSILFILSGCASTRQAVIPDETVEQQLDAAQKVMGAVGNKEMTRDELRSVAEDIKKNESSRSAAEKIIRPQGNRVIKYSPATGKHYSGDLEYDPETGVKLEVLPE